jgi:hypothetical protein
MSLPSGTVTFLFTDIKGPTRLMWGHSYAMPALLAWQNGILSHNSDIIAT